jgi:hypothetical protein
MVQIQVLLELLGKAILEEMQPIPPQLNKTGIVEREEEEQGEAVVMAEQVLIQWVGLVEQDYNHLFLDLHYIMQAEEAVLEMAAVAQGVLE